MIRVTDTITFIQRAKEVHGNYYDYSKTEYISSYKKVIIICPLHGGFESRANSHINNPSGCPKRHRSVPIKRIGCIRRDKSTLVNGKRKCSKCGLFLDISDFGVRKNVRDGLNSICKKCQALCTKISNQKRPPKTIEEKKKENKRAWLRYLELHGDEITRRKKEREVYLRERRIIAQIARKLRSRIRGTVKNKSIRTHTADFLGCSLEFFKEYIESLWTEGMTWENHTYYGWHLDHIIPCASFDLTKIEEQKKCFHYTNYQPLWRLPNQLKAGRYNGINYRWKNY